MYTHRPLLSVAFSFMAGIILNRYAPIPFQYLLILNFLVFVLSIVFHRKLVLSHFFLLAFFLLLGSFHAHAHQLLPKNDISRMARFYHGVPVPIEGVIISNVEHRESSRYQKTTFTLQVQRFSGRWGWKKKKGKVLVNIFRNLNLNYGDHIRLEGKLHRPFDFSTENNFSYRAYLQRKGIYVLLSVKKDTEVNVLGQNKANFLIAMALKAKKRLKDVFSKHLSPYEASIMYAVILGDRYHLPQHIRQLFVETGTAHILAISGLHIGIVAFLIFLLIKFIPIGRRWHYLITIVFLVFYAFLTGGRPSVARATIMVIVFMLGFIFEREGEGLNSLALAALLILWMNPFHLFEIGFQLSFMSVFFIIRFYPLVFHFLSKCFPFQRKWNTLFLQSLTVSIVAWWGVAGLIVYYFNIVTPITIVANLLIIPLIFAVVSLGVGLLMCSFFFPFWSSFFAVCLKFILNVMVGTVFCFRQVPGAFMYTTTISIFYILVYYISIFLLGMYCMRGYQIDKPNRL